MKLKVKALTEGVWVNEKPLPVGGPGLEADAAPLMPLYISEMKGTVLLNGYPVPSVPAGIPGNPLALLQPGPGAWLALAGDGGVPVAELHHDLETAEVKIKMRFPPGAYLTRRSCEPAVYDLQSAFGRVLVSEGPPRSQTSS